MMPQVNLLRSTQPQGLAPPATYHRKTEGFFHPMDITMYFGMLSPEYIPMQPCVATVPPLTTRSTSTVSKNSSQSELPVDRIHTLQ
jgi:hypothetical protein